MDKCMIGCYDLNKLRFIQQQNKNTFKIMYLNAEDQYKKIIYKTPIVNIPFGVEKYNFKDIINVEFTNLKGSNEVYNFYTQIKQIDEFLTNLNKEDNKDTHSVDFINNLNYELVNNIKGKTYISCIRENKKYDPMLRTHVRKTKKMIKSKVYKNKKEFPILSMKRDKGFFTIELGSLWISDDSYGIIIYFNGGILTQ